MEIHATPGADRKATEARFSVMQFSLKDEHKIPGYDTFRSVFNMDPDERSDEDCDKLRPLLETVGSFHLLLSDRDMLLKLCRALKLVTIPWGGGKDGKSHNVGMSKCGNTIGEVALREEGFRNATVTSAEASELLRIELEDYNELLRHNDKNHDHNRKVTTLQRSPALRQLRQVDMEEMVKRTFFQTFHAGERPGP
ncbi:zinc-binding domain-containing protein [Aureococcus anophagefferens]|nr:zinc-binding domain-containing protein [Aureococcus anophagefferens]